MVATPQLMCVLYFAAGIHDGRAMAARDQVYATRLRDTLYGYVLSLAVPRNRRQEFMDVFYVEMKLAGVR
jgi:hypothetical protein